ncbi:MAG TPA: serine/threonine protein kinase, partial [Gammaproteobacteria bacterium]|nr:serine/threonine protein kinase [Gammaproteobacteria bacterium]
MEIPGYQIIGTVGQGGMALVYEAIQKSLHRKVALKVLSPALVADPEFCQRFLDEGKTIARLSHPHIVTIYDIGHYEDQYFMSMEFVEGGNLRSRIENGMDEREVVRVARQVARALGYAHDHGFLHRDVKPHNVLFRADGDAVLSDFGIAKNLSENSELTRTGKSLGSPLYMSPEQIRGEPLDARSDLYSLGVVIYQMLTGYAPYLATTPDSTTRMHLSCPLPKLPDAQEKFQPIIRRLLAKSRNNRFLNAWELIEALDAIPLDATAPASPPKPDVTQTMVVEPPDALPPPTPPASPAETTQELDPAQREKVLKNLDATRIVASRDDDPGLAATQEQTPAASMESPEK